MNVKNILIIKLSWIGDILFTIPSFNLLKHNFPDSRITVITLPQNKAIFSGIPGIDRILTFNRQVFKEKKLGQISKHLTALYNEMKAEKYDLAIDYQGSGETAMLSFLSGAPNRLGITKKGRRFCQRFYTHWLENNDTSHRVDQNLELLLHFGLNPFPADNRFRLPEEKLLQAKNFLLTEGYLLEKPIVYLQPFAGKTHKNWPLKNYLALADYWKDQGAQVIFGGGPGEVELLKPVANKFLTTAGKMDLLTSAGLMKLSTIIIGNDTGPLHLAVALQKRVLMLMGPSKTEEFGPYQHPDWVIRPSGSNTMTDLSIAEVIAASAQALAEKYPTLAEVATSLSI